MNSGRTVGNREEKMRRCFVWRDEDHGQAWNRSDDGNDDKMMIIYSVKSPLSCRVTYSIFGEEIPMTLDHAGVWRPQICPTHAWVNWCGFRWRCHLETDQNSVKRLVRFTLPMSAHFFPHLGSQQLVSVILSSILWVTFNLFNTNSCLIATILDVVKLLQYSIYVARIRSLLSLIQSSEFLLSKNWFPVFFLCSCVMYLPY